MPSKTSPSIKTPGNCQSRAHLHPVEQRTGDGVEHVGGADEEDLREVEGHIEVVVSEGVVLLGVQQLEQRRRGVALHAAAELVDLVDKHQRVAAL